MSFIHAYQLFFTKYTICFSKKVHIKIRLKNKVIQKITDPSSSA